MVSSQGFVTPANWSLSGAKSGPKIGRMLSTALKDVVANEAHNLCKP